MKLSFHGADRGVTGSCHHVECAGKNILIDYGLYQGAHELEEDNVASFGFDAPAIDYVLLTHAHLDHCGRLPLLVKRGFRALARGTQMRPRANGHVMSLIDRGAACNRMASFTRR